MKFTIIIDIPDDVLAADLAKHGETLEQYASESKDKLHELAADLAMSFNGAKTTTTVEYDTAPQP